MTPTVNAMAAAIQLLKDANIEMMGIIVSKQTFERIEFEARGAALVTLSRSKVREIVLDGVRIRESRVG